MDQLLPPPNGSPEEIQAWNAMMDTMVTFIKASTTLINTITSKVQPGGRAVDSKKGAKVPQLLGGCEPECETCQPKPPCGICGDDTKTPSPSPKPVAQAAPPPEPVAEAPPQAPEENADAPTETEEASEAPEDAAPAADPAPAESSGVVADAAPSQAGGTKKCNCAAIRAQRLADEKKERCSCSRKGRTEEPIEEKQEDEEDAEAMCGCGATEGNTEALMRDMVQKLDNAQQEIAKLQEEMARLYRMDASKRIGPHGGPNPAALYREIMRDSDVPAQRSISHRRPPSMCIPCDDPNASRFAGDTPAMPSAPRGLMRPAPMQGRSPFYTPPQPPCRRAPRAEMSMYGSSYDPGPGRVQPPLYPQINPESSPDYWRRSEEFEERGAPQRKMVVCPSLKAPAQEPPPRRMLVCRPPPARPPHGGCDPNNCRLDSN
ncbi:proline-, glutamic acid- and leucine-rich protein 1 isoform X1 [Dendroctonus ponderosae]|uniref:proline-, glutamic acid- and leucine-rich protein 1 isoform X1 n=1 Tax=Dendroctonus ponderosae TaxID=77166 RepID=UPI002034F1D7|nr:proline-, glutamic acid- and leucine-rich protein 1 isoform X1 [Dendroctonus ponderosae]KAH1008590.1 hypothetical protein HUJ05_009134 [Dendroctonus ponderosae]